MCSITRLFYVSGWANFPFHSYNFERSPKYSIFPQKGGQKYKTLREHGKKYSVCDLVPLKAGALCVWPDRTDV
jgi:hypothetical protein